MNKLATPSAEDLLHIAQNERDLLNACDLLKPLKPQVCWAGGVAIHQTVEVTPALGSFPAITHYNKKYQTVELDYDVLTHSELVTHYTPGNELSYATTQSAYVGAGLARLLFMVQGAQVPPRKLTAFSEAMSDQNKLLGIMYESFDLKPKDGILRKLINDADAPAQINGLRLSLGVWKHAHDGDMFADGLEEVFKQSLDERLARKPDYMGFANIFKVSEVGAEDTFAEFISDIQIAASCPMDEEELRGTIKLLT